jgi:pSer/pThr/pTyr-binding forkhead associated (FHA) protein
MIYKPVAPPETMPVTPEELGVEREVVSLRVGETTHEIRKRHTVLGRSKDCDIQIADPNVSRRHAELRREGTAFWLVDLGSTNGIDVNGRRQARAKLHDGDRVTLGTTELVFRLGPG